MVDEVVADRQRNVPSRSNDGYVADDKKRVAQPGRWQTQDDPRFWRFRCKFLIAGSNLRAPISHCSSRNSTTLNVGGPRLGSTRAVAAIRQRNKVFRGNDGTHRALMLSEGAAPARAGKAVHIAALTMAG
jgi:hypothetical protein